MNIVRAVYSNPQNDNVTVELDTGGITHLPYPCNNYHDEYLQEFLNSGGVIDPHVEVEPHEITPLTGRATKTRRPTGDKR